MTCKIEQYSNGHRTTIRLIGQMREEHLPDLQRLIDGCRPTTALDLEELSLVDLETVRFLGRCENDGVSLLRCSRYIRAWIKQEQEKSNAQGTAD
jgi:hypothetical protein